MIDTQVKQFWILGVHKNSELVVEMQGTEVSVHQVWVPWISEGFLRFIPRIGEVDLLSPLQPVLHLTVKTNP